MRSVSVGSTRRSRLRRMGLVEKSGAGRGTGRGGEASGGLGVRLLRETWWKTESTKWFLVTLVSSLEGKLKQPSTCRSHQSSCALAIAAQ